MNPQTQILIIGAGRSSVFLIEYLANFAAQNGFSVLVADANIEQARRLSANLPACQTIELPLSNKILLAKTIAQSHVVVSMLPAMLHIEVAKICLEHQKSLFTASYISPELKRLHQKALKNNVLFLNELGLDPGIDHLSALKIIDTIHKKGGKILSFKSYTGGLVAPKSDTNIWGYKFSWNPRNVVVAGQNTAKFIENGQQKFIPYQQLFTRIDTIAIDHVGVFEGYANRDSLQYKQLYGLQDIATLLRGTLRKQHFCSAWNVFVQLGMTDDSYTIEGSKDFTKCQFLACFLPSLKPNEDIKTLLINKLNINENEIKRLDYLKFFEPEPIAFGKDGTPAQLLQAILEPLWKLELNDKDRIVMIHLFDYTLNQKTHHLTSYLVQDGENQQHTAMAKTVGLPLAIAVKLYLQGNFKNLKGVLMPNLPLIYEPILTELETLGIRFIEKID